MPAAARKPFTLVTPSWFHREVVAALSDLVIMAVARVDSRVVRYRLVFLASHRSVARTVTFTTLAESYEVVARRVQVVFVVRSRRPTATVPERVARAAVMSL